MSEGRASLRAVVGLAIVVVGAVEVQTLVHTVRARARLRERVLRTVREAVVIARPRLAMALLPGGSEAWAAAAREAIASSLASEVEVYDARGVRLFAHPSPSPVEHWPEPFHVGPQPTVLTLGPIAGEATRVLTYASFRSGDRVLTLRFSTAVPELVEDLRDTRELLIGHGLALGVLLLAGGLVLLPARAGDPTPQGALDAYEHAMARLRDRGEALSRAHASERERMETRLREKDAMARAGELTAGIVHEIRNGLGTISGYARMLERDSADSAEAGRLIRAECETLEAVVRRFMEFVKQERLNLAPFDLRRTLARVAAREAHGRDGGRVDVESGGEVVVVGDEELLERAFENLVRNARDAAGARGRVAIEVRNANGEAWVSIADDGPGPPSELGAQPRPFFTTKPGGLGLGLPLAYKIVRLHGGRLDLEARPPRGAVARVALPVQGPPPP